MSPNNEQQNLGQGITAGIGASLIWGTYPLWYRPLSHIHTYELLANRILWSVIFLMPLLFFIYRKGDEFRRLIRDYTKLPVVLVCATILAFWWFIYMYCVTNNRVLEAGLGYYLGPILTVVMGVVFLKEKIDLWSAASVLVSFAGIGYYTFATQGHIPYFAIALGLCYAGYTVYKRAKVTFDSQISVAFELLALVPAALLIFGYYAQDGSLQTFHTTTIPDNVLLFSLGVINVLPMWWYTVAARNVPTVPMSFIQYISPTCNFLLAVFWFSEPFSKHSLIMFVLVWVGVGIYTARSIYRLHTLRVGSGIPAGART
jgi:chloramphenicol-sensitive protein RarD